MIDPHTAVALKVASEHAVDGVPMIVRETAQAAKFSETIVEALGVEADVPKGLEGMVDRPQRSADVETVKR